MYLFACPSVFQSVHLSVCLYGGYYSTLIKAGLRLRIVSLNTVYYYTNDKQTAKILDPANQFQWLDDVITNASKANEKVRFTDSSYWRSLY